MSVLSLTQDMSEAWAQNALSSRVDSHESGELFHLSADVIMRIQNKVMNGGEDSISHNYLHRYLALRKSNPFVSSHAAHQFLVGIVLAYFQTTEGGYAYELTPKKITQMVDEILPSLTKDAVESISSLTKEISTLEKDANAAVDSLVNAYNGNTAQFSYDHEFRDIVRELKSVKESLGSVISKGKHLLETTSNTSTGPAKKKKKILPTSSSSSSAAKSTSVVADDPPPISSSPSTSSPSTSSPSTSSPSTSSPSTSSPTATIVEKDEAEEKAEVTLKRVEDDIQEAGKQLKELQDTAASITMEEAATMDPLMTKQVLDKLYRRVLTQNEALMRDLLLLDALQVNNEKVKERRRDHARAVQRVMDSLDSLASNVASVKSIAQQRVEEMEKEKKEKEETEKAEKLKTAEKKHENENEKVKEKEKEKKEEEDEDEEEEEEEEEEKTKSKNNNANDKEKEKIISAINKNLKEIHRRFNQLTFEPSFKSVEEQDKYILTSAITSMKNSDIELSLSRNNALQVKGKRLPSVDDVYEMVVSLQERGYPTTIDNILRIGSGKYGVWSESFRCPTDVDVDAITAKYANNILTVTLPRKPISKPRLPSQNYAKSPPHHHRSLYNDPFQQLFGSPYGGGARLF